MSNSPSSDSVQPFIRLNKIFKVWSLNMSLGFVFGWFFHSMISHLWTGDHEYILTRPQFIMHNVSLTGCALIYLNFLNKATRTLFGFSMTQYGNIYLTIPTLLFWIGFYLKAVPLDVFLWFASIGLLNGFFIKKRLSLNNNAWIIWSTVSGVAGFIVAVLVLIPLEKFLPSPNGLLAHVILFTLLGILAGIPMACLSGLLLKNSLKSWKPVEVD
jgi:hypothetical protein